MFKKDAIKLYILGTFLLILTAGVYFREVRTDWSDYQAEFRGLVAEKFGEERAAQIPAGIQQIWVKDLDRVDRCITCHQAVEWKGLEDAPEPYRTHPKDILETHPLEMYGCTSCHGGQGFSTTLPDAHGNVEHWEEPLLGKEIGDTYLIKNRKALMEMNCNACHRYERETKGMEYINQAKALVQDKSCRACHLINGRGGILGPDLSFEGEKPTEQFDYGRLGGKHSVFAWHVAHFQNPKMLSPDSVMPSFGFSSEQAQALSLLVMSWRKNLVPAHYIPGVQLRDMPSEEEKEKERRMLEGEGAFFVKNSCFICHSVDSLGVESASKIGPDLSDAVINVQSRMGRTLDDFLMEPTGTMSVVLATQIPLTKEQRQEAIALLKVAHQRKQEQQNKQQASPSPAPTGK
ncbi:MAG: hypothetical protein KF855_16450 [Acidobacteria bacterium]|nr:hypothetical protein [Acidobacteriota bacterium]